MRAKIMQTVFRLMILSVMLVGSSVNAEIEAAQDSYGGKSILFWSPEQQRLGYGSMADIFPTRRVVANTQAVPLEMAAAEQLIDGSFEYVVPFGEKTQTVDGGVDAFMQRMRTAGLIVVKDGEVRLERYGLGHNAQRPWVSFSVTKSVVSMLVGAAIKDGFINSVDDPVTDYLPHLRNGAYAGVSVGQLLQMSSGVKWNEDYTDPQADVAVAPLGGMPLYRYMSALPRVAEQGREFNYNTGETNLVGAMLRAAIGNNLSSYLTAKIWQPFGMQADANWLLDTEYGSEVGGCCISATLRDYARLGLFALNGGKQGNKESVLPDNWMQASTRPSPGQAGYGYSWWLMQPEVFAAEGVFGQIIWVDRRHNLVIALQSAWPKAWSNELEAELMAFIAALTAEVTQQDLESEG